MIQQRISKQVKGEHRFDIYLSCVKFHLLNSYVFKFGKKGHIQSFVKLVHFTTTNTELCKSDFINLDDFNNHTLSLFTTSSNSLDI